MAASKTVKSNPQAKSWISQELAALEALYTEYRSNSETQLSMRDEEEDIQVISKQIKERLGPQLLSEIADHKSAILQIQTLLSMTPEERAAAEAALKGGAQAAAQVGTTSAKAIADAAAALFKNPSSPNTSTSPKPAAPKPPPPPPAPVAASPIKI